MPILTHVIRDHMDEDILWKDVFLHWSPSSL